MEHDRTRTHQNQEATPTRNAAGRPSEVDRDERLAAIWKRAYEARGEKDLVPLYKDWSDSYDADHDAVGFFGHVRAAEVLARYTAYGAIAPVLDAGAGTGAAGKALTALGFGNLTALDLSASMLEKAAKKGVYRHLLRANLAWPLDAFPSDFFHAAILVGVFSYGQAPAHALEEIIRVVRPGGVIVFTMRSDFFESDAMGVRSKIEALEAAANWRLVELTPPELYLPRKDPSATFRVWCYRVLETKSREVPSSFVEAVAEAFSKPGKVRRLDHAHIWDSVASRLYDRYIESPDYYLNDCEEEILQAQARKILGNEGLFVELGCGSAQKIQHVLRAAVAFRPDQGLDYVPIDLSPGALDATSREVQNLFGDKVRVDARRGSFAEVLPTLPKEKNKVMFFFGSSIGNIENLEDTVAFLRMLRDRMGPGDRFIAGMDLDKDPEILRRAYEAGPTNLAFFLNMIRRINHELGANLDLDGFVQDSTYDEEPGYEGIANRCVSLKLTSTTCQEVYLAKLDLHARLEPGDAIQVGCSRKFRLQDIPRLAGLAGLRLRRQWLDKRGYLSINEMVRADAPE